MMIEISDAAWDVVKIKALALNAPETAVVEAMILEFAPSTKEDWEGAKRRRDQARDEYLRSNPSDSPLSSHFRAWSNGYRVGWLHFQIRKKNLFDLRKPEEYPR